MRFWKGFSRIKVHLIPWLTREVWGTETGIPHLKSGRTRTRGQASSLQALGCLLISTSPAALHRGSQCGRRPTAPRTREGSSSSGLLSDSPGEGRRRGLLASPSHRPIYPRTVHCAVTVSRMNQVRPTPQAEGAYQFLSRVLLRAVPRTGRPRCRLTHSRSLCKGPGRERRTAPQQRGAGGCLSRPWQPDPKTAGWHLCPSGPSLSLVAVQDSSRGTKNRPGQW